MEILSTFLPVIIVILVIVIIVLFLLATIKVVPSNEVLVITGVGATKKVTEPVPVQVRREDGTIEIVEEERTFFIPRIKPAGAAFVIPFIQHADRFKLDVQKTEQKSDIVKTKTGVEVMIDWVIAYSPNTASLEALQPAVRQFMGKEDEEIEELISSLVAGGVRAVVSTMDPVAVMVGKEELDDAVQKNIAGHMAELGYVVQLYIQEVRDTHDSTYFYDIAAEDRENTRRTAANITADNEQSIRERQAETNRKASEAELEAEVQVAAKTRDIEVQKSQFQIETDRAKADANIAGQLRQAEREKELAANEGQVEVERQSQANLAALKHQEVEVTNAETNRRRQEIAAEAEANVAKRNAEGRAQAATIDADGEAKAVRTRAEASAEATKVEGEADASVVQIQGEAHANAVKAQGIAEADIKKASGLADAEAAKAQGLAEAEVKKANGLAEAETVKAQGLAEAEAIKAQGLAEAEAIKAKGLAEAEAQRQLADAMAANDAVNFEIKKIEIENEARVSIATNVAEVMASVGEKATFYDFGGSASRDESGNLLTSVLTSIPQVFGKADLMNKAINGEEVTDTIRSLSDAVVGPLGQALSGKTDDDKQLPDAPVFDETPTPDPE